MKCPQCGAETPDAEWNCVSCRINIYWATQHYEELAEIRKQQGLNPAAPTPAFLIKTHGDAMQDRASRGGRIEHRVRQIARQIIKRKA